MISALARDIDPDDLDMVVCALLLTESAFRPAMHRLIEVIFAAAWMIATRSDPMTTIGMSQVGVKYWREVFPRTSELLAASFSLNGNYQVCRHHRNVKGGTSTRDILISYNGIPSVAYVRRFRESLAAVVVARAELSGHLRCAGK